MYVVRVLVCVASEIQRLSCISLAFSHIHTFSPSLSSTHTHTHPPYLPNTIHTHTKPPPTRTHTHTQVERKTSIYALCCVYSAFNLSRLVESVLDASTESVN